MKVYDQSLTGTSSSASTRAQETQRTDRKDTSRTSGGAASGDRVELSGALGALSRALAASSSQRAGKVQALSAQYASGTYRANAAGASHGMVSEALSAEAR